MAKVTPIKILKRDYEEKFSNFDYEFYKQVIANRENAANGKPKASCLVKEIGLLSSFFASDTLRVELDNLDAAYCGFTGWQFAAQISRQPEGYNSLTSLKVERLLLKQSKSVKKFFKDVGVKASLNEIAWIVYCCAMLKIEFYQEFNYELKAFMTEPGESDTEARFQIAYTIPS